MYLNELDRLARCAEDQKIPVVLMKGVALSKLLYDDIY